MACSPRGSWARCGGSVGPGQGSLPGWRSGVRWLDVELTHQPSGKPEIRLSGRVRELANQLHVARISISISHSDRYAVALVIFESDG